MTTEELAVILARHFSIFCVGFTLGYGLAALWYDVKDWWIARKRECAE